jgi:hypothetical protein
LSYSPLEGSFGKQQKSKNKKLIALVGFLLIAGIGGGVFAANITIASGAIEFGQGVASATACDSTITVVPSATYDGSDFTVSKVVLEGVDASACGTKTLTLKAIYSSNATIGSIAHSVASTAATINITVTPTPAVTSSVLAKFLLESN